MLYRAQELRGLRSLRHSQELSETHWCQSRDSQLPTTMLELRGVSKQFLGIAAVDKVSFSARAGEITGYLGPNGSGKSTTMKMITGLLQTTSGEILLDG